MDTFTRRYLLVLGTLAMAGGGYWLAGRDGRVSELNAMLARDAELTAYPYQFRVLSLENGVARMTSPRSAELSAIQGLRIMFPELKAESAVSESMVEAQKALAAIQSRAADLVTQQPDVTRVAWVLDERWLNMNGVFVQ